MVVVSVNLIVFDLRWFLGYTFLGYTLVLGYALVREMYPSSLLAEASELRRV